MKQLSVVSLLSVSFGLSLVACGGDGGGDPGTITPDTATASVGQTVELVSALNVADGSEASGSVLALIGLDQGILLPDAPGAKPAPAPSPSSAPSVAPTVHGTADCDARGCVFDHFGDDLSGYAWDIDGTITTDGSTYTFALDLTIDSSMEHLHWRMDGDLTVTPTSIDGELRIVADGTTGSSTVHWDVTVDYVDIVLDPTGCPISGRLDAHSIFTGDGTRLWDLEGFVTFGPTCGEIH